MAIQKVRTRQSVGTEPVLRIMSEKHEAEHRRQRTEYDILFTPLMWQHQFRRLDPRLVIILHPCFIFAFVAFMALFDLTSASGAFEPASSFSGGLLNDRIRDLHNSPFEMRRIDDRTYVMTACEGGIVDHARIDEEVSKIRREKARVIVDGQAVSACILFLEALALADKRLVCATERAQFLTHAFISVDGTGLTRWAGHMAAPYPDPDEIALTINQHRSAIMRSWIKHNRQWLTFTDYVELPQPMMFALLGQCPQENSKR